MEYAALKKMARQYGWYIRATSNGVKFMKPGRVDLEWNGDTEDIEPWRAEAELRIMQDELKSNHRYGVTDYHQARKKDETL